MPPSALVESEDEVEENNVNNQSGGDGSDGEEPVEEYEIEQVLDAKRGFFPEGRIGYFVKWKGYGEEENSWVDEQDAVNAKELVDEYWRKNPQKRRGPRKSGEKQSPKKAPKSAITGDDSDAGSATVKKRGRKSAAKLESENEMEVDQPEPRASKKPRKSASQALKASTESPEPEKRVLKTMEAYMNRKNWHDLVATIDTVERADDGTLYVFFTLVSGDAVKEKSQVCKERFPLKLLDFYEDNLRWRNAEELD